MARAQISHCVGREEIGKSFSAVALTYALMPFINTNIYTEIYNSNVSEFPGAIFLFSGAILTLAAICSFITYTQRWRMLSNDEQDRRRK